MPIRIKVELNGREIAVATAENVSRLADISDYWVAVHEFPEPSLGINEIDEAGLIRKHDRNQSVWALVEKVAAFARASQI